MLVMLPAGESLHIWDAENAGPKMH